MFKAILLYFISIFIIFALMSAAYSREELQSPFLSGPYVLSVVLATGEIKNLYVFPDPQWGVYHCHAQRRNVIRKTGLYLYESGARITCSRWYEGEV